MTKLRQLAGQTVVYGASSIFGRAINFALVPLYTQVLNPGEYGIVTELYAYVAFLNIVFTYGMETAYFRFSTMGKDPHKYYHLAQTSLLVSTLLLGSLLILLADPIAATIGYPGREDYIIWFSLILAIDTIVVLPFAKLRLEKKGFKFASFKIANILINIGLNLFFILWCPWWLSNHSTGILTDFIRWIYDPNLGIGYIFISNLIANAFYLVVFLPDLIKTKIKFSKEWVAMIIYAAPLLIVGLAGVTNDMLSRVMLKYLLPDGFYPGRTSLEALGIFGACYKLSVFMTLSVQAFRYAFEPFFFSESKQKDSPQMLSKVMTYFIIFGSFAWLVISLLLPVIAPVFLRRQSYLEGLEIVPFLLGGGLFLGIFYNLSVWYKLTDRTMFGAYLTTGGAILTVLLNILLIPLFGYTGSAVTTFTVYGLMMFVSYIFSNKYYPVPYQVGKGTFYLGLSGGLILAAYFCSDELIFRYIFIIFAISVFIISAWILDIRRVIKQFDT